MDKEFGRSTHFWPQTFSVSTSVGGALGAMSILLRLLLLDVPVESKPAYNLGWHFLEPQPRNENTRFSGRMECRFRPPRRPIGGHIDRNFNLDSCRKPRTLSAGSGTGSVAIDIGTEGAQGSICIKLPTVSFMLRRMSTMYAKSPLVERLRFL